MRLCQCWHSDATVGRGGGEELGALWSTRLHTLMVPVGGSGYSVGVCSRTGSPYTVSSVPSSVVQQCGTTARARWLSADSAGAVMCCIADVCVDVLGVVCLSACKRAYMFAPVSAMVVPLAGHRSVLGI